MSGLTKMINAAATAAIVIGLLSVITFFMVPRLLGWQLVVVLSGSMEPTLPVGSVAFVEPRDATTIKAGDVLTFRAPQVPEGSPSGKDIQITHRVVEVLQEGSAPAFRTQGDANLSPDAVLVPASNVVGTVRRQIPYAGLLASRIRSWQGFLLMVAIPGLVIVAAEVRRIVLEIQAMRSGRRSRAVGS